MVRLYTRVKRKLGVTTSRRSHIKRPKKHGARTFRTEEQAKEYASKLKLEKFSIAPAKKNKRFKILQ